MLENKKEMFYPNCEKTEEGTWVCQPVLVKGDIKIESEEPIVLKPKGDNFEIIKGRGAPEELLDRLAKHFERRKI
ncbi:MAG: hypothetical protein DRN78_05680 [Thermoproteota archaeon]|nr:MAG: hypothetical protein DRN78_05680 [Candidatus Korarchaeota archaeon]